MFEQVRSLYWERPFRPFRVHLKDGRVVPVEEAEQLVFSPLGHRFRVGSRENDWEYVQVPVDQVDRLEFVDAATTPQ